jgi:hypothetical protein
MKLPEKRTCYICKIEQPIENYFNDKHQSGGKHYHCKTCSAKAQKEWQCKNPLKYWARYTVKNHKFNGHEVNITKEELVELAIQTTTCGICGCELIYNKGTNGKQTLNSPSLDRKDNGHIMNLDNVWIICLRCNQHKSSKTMKEYVTYCTMIANKFKHLL